MRILSFGALETRRGGKTDLRSVYHLAPIGSDSDRFEVAWNPFAINSERTVELDPLPSLCNSEGLDNSFASER